MNRSVRPLGLMATLAGFICLVAMNTAHAQLSLALDQLSPSAQAGDTIDVTGTITNETGATLTSSDLFFNFYDFSTSLTPNQLLGETAFTLPNFTFSADTPLFSVAIAPGTTAGSVLPMYLTLEDIDGDVSNEIDLTIKVSGSTTVPEPGPAAMFSAGLLSLLAIRLICAYRPGFRRSRPV